MGKLDRIAKEEDKQAAYWLLFCYDKVKELEEQRQDILHSSPAPSYSRPATGSAAPSDPTAAKVLKLAQLQEEAQGWLEVVTKVEEGLSLRDRVFLLLRRKYRYRRGQHGWAAKMQIEFPAKMAKLTGKDAEAFWVENQNTFTRWFNRIVDHTVREALAISLIRR